MLISFSLEPMLGATRSASPSVRDIRVTFTIAGDCGRMRWDDRQDLATGDRAYEHLRKRHANIS
jgi:hypothetical protein